MNVFIVLGFGIIRLELRIYRNRRDRELKRMFLCLCVGENRTRDREERDERNQRVREIEERSEFDCNKLCVYVNQYRSKIESDCVLHLNLLFILFLINNELDWGIPHPNRNSILFIDL